MIMTNGRLTSGSCSTRSRAYENRPSTVMPIITIVAKTGLAIDVRVIHISGLSWQLTVGSENGRRGRACAG